MMWLLEMSEYRYSAGSDNNEKLPSVFDEKIGTFQ